MKDVTGLERRSAGEVLRRRDHGRDPQGEPQSRDRADGGDDRRRARHVPLHRLHVLRRLDRDPPRIKRDPLPHQPEMRPAAPAAIAEDDQSRRLLAPPGHSQEAAGPKPPERRRAEHLAVDARLPGEKAGPPRQLRRCERVARLVHQVAGCIRSLGQDPAAAHRFGHGLGPLPIPLDDRQPLDRLGVLMVRLVACEPVEAEQRPLHERLGRLGGMQSAGAGSVDDGGDPAGTDPAQRPGRFGRRGPYPIQCELLRLPSPITRTRSTESRPRE